MLFRSYHAFSFLGILYFFFISCTQSSHRYFPAENPKTFLPPILHPATPPTSVNPDTCPPALCINIFSTKGYPKEAAGIKKIIELQPPSESSAAFATDIKNFGTEQGLALSSVLCTYCDHWGNLWIGTDGGGVSRYDGKSFINFTMSNGLSRNAVYCIMEDREHNIWFGTNGGGACRYDGRSFTTFSTASGKMHDVVHCIAETADGKLWIGTDAGVRIYDGKKISVYDASPELAQSQVLCMAEDKNNVLWIGTNDKGVFSCSSNDCKHLAIQQGLADNHVQTIACDRKGNVWLGCTAGLTKWGGSALITDSTVNGFAKRDIQCLAFDNKGMLWIAANNTVSKFDGSKFNNVISSADVGGNMVKSITEDKNHNLWFGTYGSGIYLYAPTGCTSIRGLPGSAVNTIFESGNGNLWFGTDAGVNCYDGVRFTSYTIQQGLADNFVLSIAEKNSELWFGTYGHGISRFNRTCFTTYTHVNGLGSDTVWVITKDHQNRLWFGTSNGITMFNDTFSTYTTEQGLPENKVRAITEDADGNLWVGTDGGGVSRFDGNSFMNFGTEQGLANNSIYCITRDSKGNLWIGTAGNGISILSQAEINNLNSNSKNPLVHFSAFTTREGLSNDAVYDIVENKTGDIIIGTNEGFTLVKGGIRKDGNIHRNQIEYFNHSTGYPVNDVNVNAMLADQANVIWAGTSDKAVRFMHEAMPVNITRPLTVIQSIQLNNQSISWYDLRPDSLKQHEVNVTPSHVTEEAIVFGSVLENGKRDSLRKIFDEVCFDSIRPFYSLPVNLVLPYKDNTITLQYAAIEPAHPYLIEYQYMLVGCDHDWNIITRQTSATYGNLSQGKYTFFLRARYASGTWSKPVTFSFQILKPWYLTPLAIASYILLLVVLVWAIVQWRTRKIKREKEVLEEKVVERTNELRTERDKSETLLKNIFPDEIAQELKASGYSRPRYFDHVTVLFTDFKNFTSMSESLSPEELVNLIDYYYRAFDHISRQHGIEKIKTIGDSYMCAGGIPVKNNTHAIDATHAALAMMDFTEKEKQQRTLMKQLFFEIRIGLHTGPVVAGIVGETKYEYDIWGKTVNVAARMESSGVAGKVNVSSTTYQLIREQFKCTERGWVDAKNMGQIEMYFVEGVKNVLRDM